MGKIMKSDLTIIAWRILILVGFLSVPPAFSQENYIWDKELIRKVIITNADTIKLLADELLIPESEIKQIEIYDVDQNGAGVGDLLRVQPSRAVYPLYFVSQRCQKILAKIPIPKNIIEKGSIISISGDPKTPTERILYALASVVTKIYTQDKPLKLYFEQTEDGLFIFELMGYHSDLMKDTDVSFGNVIADTSQANVQDLLKALYKELYEEYLGWQPMAIHIVKTVRDTIIVPEGTKKK